MTIAISTKVTGALDADDKRGMISRIVEINRNRATPLPYDSGANIKASYETILTESATAEHLTNIANASTATGLQFNGFTDDDLAQIRRALADKVQAGKSIATIVEAVKAI